MPWLDESLSQADELHSVDRPRTDMRSPPPLPQAKKGAEWPPATPPLIPPLSPGQRTVRAASSMMRLTSCGRETLTACDAWTSVVCA